MCLSAPKVPAPVVTPEPEGASQRIPYKPVPVDESVNERRDKSKKKRRQQAIAKKFKPNSGIVQTGSGDAGGVTY